MPENPFDDVAAAFDHVHAIARDFVTNLPDHRAGTSIDARDLAGGFDMPLPELGCGAVDAIDQWLVMASNGITGSAGPRNFGFVIGGSTAAAAAADWLTTAIDQNTGLWVASPASAATDAATIEWLKQLFALPSEWTGSFTSGATHAHLVGLGAARQWAGHKLGFDAAAEGLGGHPPIAVLSSTEIHASAIKSLSTLGFGRKSVVKLPTVDKVLDPGSLEQKLDQLDGPVIVVANAGEVNSGAFDDLVGIADLCAAHSPGAWMHVDAAFGLYARLSPRTAHYLDGIERADSVCVDAHKWLNVPYDSGFAFVRDESILLDAFSTSAAYLEPPEGAGKDFDGHGPFFSTRFRSLAIWCTLRALGRSGYQALVERCLDNAQAFGDWIEANPATELLAPVRLNIVCWRYVPPHADDTAMDQFNRETVHRIQRDGRVFLTPTSFDGKQAIRCAFDNWATSAADVDILCQTVKDFEPGTR